MTKSTITRERIEQYANDPRMCNINDEIRELARMALAAMDSEPVKRVNADQMHRVCLDKYVAMAKEMNKLLGRTPAQPAPVVLKDHQIRELVNQLRDIAIEYHGTQQLRERIARVLRAAMLQAEPVTTANKLGNSPLIPDGYVLVPMRLTAENGAKGALSGEFSETKFVNCPECFGDDECETCDGSGRIEIKVPVSWTTIKEIWIKSVEHFAAAPQENN